MSISLAKVIAIAKKISVGTILPFREELKGDIQSSTELLTGEIEAVGSSVGSLREEVETLKEEVETLKEEGIGGEDNSLQETVSLHDYKIKEIEHHNVIQDVCIQGLFNENSNRRATIKGSSSAISLIKSKKGMATIDKIIGKTLVVNGTLKSTFESNLVTQEMIDSNLEKAENLGKYKISTGIYSNLLTPEEFLAKRKQK